jgi:sporulation protein YlmC with PRC-barrel domain
VRLKLGAPVHCSNEELGELADVVIDPVRKRITHLVVQPRHEHGVARLVPIELAEGGKGGRPVISLNCSLEEVRRFAPVQEFAYLRLGKFPVDDPDWDVGVQDVLAMPYYESSLDPGSYPSDTGIIYDRVPKGEVEIRRSSAVTSSDGHHLGHIDGFLVEGEEITHIVLEHGHLWGRREVTVPIKAVTKVETDAVTLSLSKEEVGALDGVKVHRWHGGAS